MPIEYECDGNGPHEGNVTKVFRLGGMGNLILCRACWAREDKYQVQQREVRSQPWPLGEVYKDGI